MLPPPKPRVSSTTFCQTYVALHWNAELNATGDDAERELRAVRLEVGQIVGDLREVLRDARIARDDRAGRREDARRIHVHRTTFDRAA